MRLGGDGVHGAPLEVPPEDERYRNFLDQEELILDGGPPDVDGQRHLHVHLEQLSRGVTHLSSGRRPRRMLGPPLGNISARITLGPAPVLTTGLVGMGVCHGANW